MVALDHRPVAAGGHRRGLTRRVGTLYVVGTPIGHLGDLSTRAREVLGAVDVIVAEDTRVTRKLLLRFGITTPQISCHEHSPESRRHEIVERLAHGDIALVTDAGTPSVSDPGALLVADARAAGHAVLTVPGPSAVTAALSISGLPADRYLFLGFLPRKAAERRAILGTVVDAPWTLVAFEAPHRLRAALADLASVLGDRPIAVARELTKRHEETWWGTLEGAVAHFAAQPPRGEFTLVIAGAPAVERAPWDAEAVVMALDALRATGVGHRAAARQVAAEAGWPSGDVYRLWPVDD